MSVESLATLLSVPSASVAPELVSADDVALILRVSRRTVFRLRQRGDLPPPVEVTRNIVRWRLSELHEHLAKLQARKPRRRS
jgi:predicted DNA-binding transcriptional regulator AlpA